MPPADESPLEVHEVDESRWPDLVRLMEGRGGPKHCWCLLWREPHKVRSQLDLPARRAAMQERVAAGTPIGLIGYQDDEPVAWCSVAPRETYVDLGGPEYAAGARVWSVVCFFISRRLRGQGGARTLLRAAIGHAQSRGAQVVEAFPVAPDSPSYRFMGFRPMFAAAGFEETGTVGTRRHAVRLVLDPAALA